MKYFLKDFFTISISLVAVFISWCAYSQSKLSLEYQQIHNSFLDTPSLKENTDSTTIYYSSNHDKAELQAIRIIFPKDITNESIEIFTKPITIEKHIIEHWVREYSYETLAKTVNLDSFVVVMTIPIPVMIDYNVVVYGSPASLRENRFLYFDIFITDEKIDCKFINSTLVQRCGFPLKEHYFLWNPFAKSLEDRVEEQDYYDVQELLRNQLKDITNKDKYQTQKRQGYN